MLLELNAALESGSADRLQRTVNALKLDRLKQDLEEKRKIASRRSGARYGASDLAGRLPYGLLL